MWTTYEQTVTRGKGEEREGRRVGAGEENDGGRRMGVREEGTSSRRPGPREEGTFGTPRTRIRLKQKEMEESSKTPERVGRVQENQQPLGRGGESEQQVGRWKKDDQRVGRETEEEQLAIQLKSWGLGPVRRLEMRGGRALFTPQPERREVAVGGRFESPLLGGGRADRIQVIVLGLKLGSIPGEQSFGFNWTKRKGN